MIRFETVSVSLFDATEDDIQEAREMALIYTGASEPIFIGGRVGDHTTTTYISEDSSRIYHVHVHV